MSATAGRREPAEHRVAAEAGSRVAAVLEETAADERLNQLAIHAALVLAADVDACAALLRGTPVPAHRIDPAVFRALDLEPGADVTLDPDLVERVELLGPGRHYECPRCSHRWSR